MFESKNILVTGGTGMIGTELCQILLELGGKVTAASLDRPPEVSTGVTFKSVDLKNIKGCVEICKGMDIVFHLAGVTGSPKMTQECPATFMVANLLINTNMLEAARICGVKKYLYTSTYGVYGPSEIMVEEELWNAPPSDADKFAGWAKRMGELQVEAYKSQYDWQDIYVVRPANVYGPGANFEPKNSMVVASIIKRVIDGENPLVVWGDGTAIRDFIYSKDVARGMIFTMENEIREPLNIGSGAGISIKDLVSIIIENSPTTPEISWDKTQPSGDKKRILDTSKAISYGFKPNTDLKTGIKATISWYKKNSDVLGNKYNAFEEVVK
jgi:GDP-L-fucose synthase